MGIYTLGWYQRCRSEQGVGMTEVRRGLRILGSAGLSVAGGVATNVSRWNAASTTGPDAVPEDRSCTQAAS